MPTGADAGEGSRRQAGNLPPCCGDRCRHRPSMPSTAPNFGPHHRRSCRKSIVLSWFAHNAFVVKRHSGNIAIWIAAAMAQADSRAASLCRWTPGTQAAMARSGLRRGHLGGGEPLRRGGRVVSTDGAPESSRRGQDAQCLTAAWVPAPSAALHWCVGRCRQHAPPYL